MGSDSFGDSLHDSASRSTTGEDGHGLGAVKPPSIDHGHSFGRRCGLDPTDEVIDQLLRKDYEARQMTKFAADAKARWELHLRASFDHVPAFALTTTMLNQYKANRFAQEDKPAVATVNRELQVLRRAYKLAATCDPPKVGRIPVFKLDREKNARLEFFTSEQMDKIRAAASIEGIEWRTLIELAYALGWRRGELLSLRVCDFDLLAGGLKLRRTAARGKPL